MSREAPASNQHNTIAQLRAEALVVELPENKLKMTRKVHNRRWDFFGGVNIGSIVLASALLLLLLRAGLYKEDQCREHPWCSVTARTFRFSTAGKMTGFLTFYRGIPPVRSARMVRLAAASPPDGLEYGRASSNNNEEGCDAVSCLLSKSGLVARAAVAHSCRGKAFIVLIIWMNFNCFCRRYCSIKTDSVQVSPLFWIPMNLRRKQCPQLMIRRNYNYI